MVSIDGVELQPMRDQPASAASPAVETSLVYAHGLAAIVTLLISVGFGVLASIEMLVPDLVGNSPWLTWGRLRYDHTQGIMLGWLGNAFFAFLYHGVPVLTGTPRDQCCGWASGSSDCGTSRSSPLAGFWCWPASASRSNGPNSRW